MLGNILSSIAGKLARFSPATSLPSLNCSMFHKLLQPFHGIHHHTADFGECRSGKFLPTPPALKRRDAHAKERRRFLLANAPIVNLPLRCWLSPETSSHPANHFLDEFFFSQSSRCWALLTEDACERVRDAVSHRVDELLKVDRFLLDFK